MRLARVVGGVRKLMVTHTHPLHLLLRSWRQTYMESEHMVTIKINYQLEAANWLRPGKAPWGKKFVNYFSSRWKKAIGVNGCKNYIKMAHVIAP